MILKTNIAKQYKYPHINGEKFVTSRVIEYQYSFAGPLQLKDDIFMLCEYREDGYTKQGMKLQVNNPIGEAMSIKVRSVVQKGRKQFSLLIKYYAWLRVFHISRAIAAKYYYQIKLGNLAMEPGFLEDCTARGLSYIWVPFLKKKLGKRLDMKK